VVIDNILMTSLSGLFATGDVQVRSTKQAAAAAGEGVTVAFIIREYLKESG
jgi:thioredoxin reductase